MTRPAKPFSLPNSKKGRSPPKSSLQNPRPFAGKAIRRCCRWRAALSRAADEVERVAMNIIELSTRQNFALWLATGKILHGWARSVFGDTEQGILWINEG